MCGGTGFEMSRYIHSNQGAVMLTIETIASDLATLSISRCVGASKSPSECPNRIVATEKTLSRICQRCDDARARILGFVVERVNSIIHGNYGSNAEDIVSDVVLN